MGKTSYPLISYSGGEVSPKLDSRVDQQKYGSWMRQQRNMIAYRTGPLTRAPGTLQIAQAKYPVDANNYCVCLYKFVFSEVTSYEMEFGQGYIRFFYGDTKLPVESSPGVPYEIASPYQAAALAGDPWDTEVWQLDLCQINDVTYITSPDRNPYILTRFSNTNWTLEEVNFFIPPLLDPNGTGMYIGVAAGGTTGPVTLSINAAAWVAATFYQIGDSVNDGGGLFTCIVSHESGATFAADQALGYWKTELPFLPGHVGSTWQLSHIRNADFVDIDISADGSSAEIEIIDKATFNTYGTWTAEVALERLSGDGVTWETYRIISSKDDANATESITLTAKGTYRLTVQNWVSMGGATTPRAVLTVEPTVVRGLVQITAYINPFLVDGVVVKELETVNSTRNWNEGAWSDVRGYPQAVCSFQQRVIYGFSEYEPQRLWGSVTNDLENFDRGDATNTTDSFAYDLNAAGRGRGQWLVGQNDLFVGFNGAEWVVNSGQTSGNGTASGAAIGPSAINAFEQGDFGSAEGIAPVVAGNFAFFVQRQGDSVRQIKFDLQTNHFQSQDLCALSDHLFVSRIAQMGYQARWRHQSLLWTVTKQGTLCGLTYDLDSEIGGWCKRDTGYGQTDPDGVPISPDNGFESVSVLPGTHGEDDQVWVVVNRLVGGVKYRFIELVTPINWEETFTGAPNPPSADITQAYYVDCGTIVTSPGSLTFSNPKLANLVGRYVVGLADGNAFGPLLVGFGGTVTLPDAFPTTVTTVIIGLPLPYTGQPMRLDQDPRAGNTQGQIKNLSDVFIRVWNAMGGSISNGTVQYDTWVAGTSYVPGNNVISPATLLAYQCVIAVAGAVDPYADTTNWVKVPKPVFNEPVRIPYTANQSNPFLVATMIRVPTDIRMGPWTQPVMNTDPQCMVVGNDALPLTVLGIALKYDLTSVN